MYNIVDDFETLISFALSNRLEIEDLTAITVIKRNVERYKNQVDLKDKEISELKNFRKHAIDKFENKFSNAGNANTLVLAAVSELFDIYCENEAIRNEIDQLKAKNEKLLKCAEFYAEDSNWDNASCLDESTSIDFSDHYYHDYSKKVTGGKLAIQTLKEIEESK